MRGEMNVPPRIHFRSQGSYARCVAFGVPEVVGDASRMLVPTLYGRVFARPALSAQGQSWQPLAVMMCLGLALLTPCTAPHGILDGRPFWNQRLRRGIIR